METTNTLQVAIQTYEETSKQKINSTKSFIFYGKGISHARKNDIACVFCIQVSNGNEKYLGLLYLIARSKADISAHLKKGYGRKRIGGRRNCFQRKVKRF